MMALFRSAVWNCRGLARGRGFRHPGGPKKRKPPDAAHRTALQGVFTFNHLESQGAGDRPGVARSGFIRSSGLRIDRPTGLPGSKRPSGWPFPFRKSRRRPSPFTAAGPPRNCTVFREDERIYYITAAGYHKAVSSRSAILKVKEMGLRPKPRQGEFPPGPHRNRPKAGGFGRVRDENCLLAGMEQEPHFHFENCRFAFSNEPGFGGEIPQRPANCGIIKKL